MKALVTTLTAVGFRPHATAQIIDLRTRFVGGEPCHRNAKILHRNYEREIMSAKIIFIAREVRVEKCASLAEKIVN